MKGFITQASRLAEQLFKQGLILTGWAAADKLARWVTGGPSARFSKITEELWLGGQPSRGGVKKLVEKGFSAIINLRAEFDYASWFDKISMNYLHLPTRDNESPTLAQLQKGVRFIHKNRTTGKIYIHCWEGLGRGPTLVAAFLVSTGMKPFEAWETIRLYRPFIRPTILQQERLEEFHALSSSMVSH